MSVDVYTQSDPTSHELSRIIKALDKTSPELYHVRWESERRNPKTTYDVEEFRFGNGPKMKILGQKSGSKGRAEFLVDSNPPGQPQLVHLRKDGNKSYSRLVEIKVMSDDFKWRHKLKYVSEDLRHKLNFPTPGTDDK